MSCAQDGVIISTDHICAFHVLDFAEELFLDPAKMWRQLTPEKQRLFQSSIFPEGTTFDGEFCRTPVTASFVAGLRDLEGVETRMGVPKPSELEPSAAMATGARGLA